MKMDCVNMRPGFHRLSLRSLYFFAALLFCFLPFATQADSVVVFNEIMYHPATNESALEWVELYNQNAVDVDVGEWRISGGIDYVFPIGTVVKGGGHLVVSIAPAALMAQAGISNVLGPFTGRLSNGGEQIRLRDLNDRVMDEVDYGTDGDWPLGADGSGMSLAKKDPNLASQPAESWTVSRQSGGTPGAPNFPAVTTNGAPVSPLAFNEVSAASGSNFWLEICNAGQTAVELAGAEIYRSGVTGYRFPVGVLEPGGIVALTQTQLGFGAADQDKLFLATPGRCALTTSAGRSGRRSRTSARSRFGRQR